jgi:TolB-like protein/TolA-binding protein
MGVKRFVFRPLLSAVLIIAFASVAAAEFKKTKIAVLDFQLQGGKQDNDMGKIVAEWLITALVKEGRFDVIERRLLEKVLTEQKMHASGLVDESSASRLGKVLGAKIVITGSVMQFQNVMEVNARIIEVESSSIVAAENVKSASAAKLEDLVVQMAEKIIRDFPLEGYIVQREGSKVLIDLGKRAGIKTGMQFIVYQEGRVIKHPKTGEILDIERIETGIIEITEVKTKTTDGKIVREAGENSISTSQLVKSTIELIPQAENRRRDRERSAPRAAVVLSEGNLAQQLASIDGQIEELRKMKLAGDNGWKNRYRELDKLLLTVEKQNKRSADVYLSRARLVEAIDKVEHAEKFISKALSIQKHYPRAYELKGDMYIWDCLKPKPAYGRSKALKRAIDGYEDAAKYAAENDFQADMYLKIGNAYAELQKPKKAQDFWHKAATAAPSSPAAGTAREKMK